MRALPYVLIVVVLLIAGGLYLQFHPKDRVQAPVTGNAPEFVGIAKWLNSEPLTIQSLRGKVVLVDFWTYSCINCVRTLPYVTRWYDTYKDQGLVVVGVHAPEFAFEKDTNNVRTAIERFKIHYPVAQDNDLATWTNYHNQYWPAEYLIDKQGNVVYTHFGEGKYDQTERKIRELLGLEQAAISKGDTSFFEKIKSPEMYFGLSRLENLVREQIPAQTSVQFTFPHSSIPLNTFALGGNWHFDVDKAITDGQNSRIWLKFASPKVFMVAASKRPQTVRILDTDGKLIKEVEVNESTLYTLFESGDGSEREIIIEIPEAGFEAYTFTFG
jgi:thiol-disulfide isomerase/thioredoxin